MKVLSLEQTRAALPFDLLIHAIDEGFASDCTSPLRHHHFMQTPGQADDVLLLMPAWRNEGWGGIKLVNVHPGNSAKGLPAISSTYVLFDRETGEHILILNGGELTARRTAAASALAAKRLARPDSKRLLVVGAGRVGSNIPHAYRAVLPIQVVEVWSNTQAKARQLVDDLRSQGINAECATDLQAAVGRADIISCATLARDPIIKGEWLKPGQHLDLIGSFTPDMREADDEVMRRAKVFIDTEHAKLESGDIKTPLQTGVISEADIIATLDQMCRENAYPRASAEDITLFKGVGTAIEDLSAAVLAWKTIEQP
jgi:ornithine cyclodeaminase/alanine dehydrogenase-like protein (mu-crystallin family)